MRNLSKSKLIAFRQCPKRLWLELHRAELRDDAASEMVFQIGNQVGELARAIYDPAATGTTVDLHALGHGAALALSATLLKDSQLPVFEAGMSIDGALAYADVMLPDLSDGSLRWKMIEVKSSTSVKDYHRDDVAVQAYIAAAAGIPVCSIAVAHIDNSFVYQGDNNYRGLLREADLTEQARARGAEVEQWIAAAQAVAEQAEEPEVATGAHCSSPFTCGFCTYCNRGKVFPDYPLSSLPRFSATKHELMEELGIDDLREVPDEHLNAVQARVKQHSATNTPYFDAAGAAAELAPHGFPAYFLDFETANMAVPVWKGTRPYQQIPFQFSLHILTEKNGDLRHAAFLDLTAKDPRRGFAESLVAHCGGKGPIYVYNAGFEGRVTRELAQAFPDLAPALGAIVGRLVDLLPIARAHYYHPSQQGSWSLKAVLPAAIPELSYDDLQGVANGAMAVSAFSEAIHPDTTPERKAGLHAQLLAYCLLDTLAMVRLWEFFQGAATSGFPRAGGSTYATP
jgi:hypothetical protein